MYETPITIVGNLVDEPNERTTPSGRVVTKFRVASTPRRFNRTKGTYQDSDTLWMNIVCWTDLARNAAASLHKGDPVLLFGRLSCREYIKDEQRRMIFEVTADALGHNLARGTSAFMKVNRSVGSASVPVTADGLPEELPDEYLDEQLRQADEFAGVSLSSASPEEGDTMDDGPDVDDFDPLPNSGPLVPIG